MTQIVLTAFILSFATNSYSAGENFCRHLFVAQNETALKLTGIVFNPPTHLTPSKNTISSTSWKQKTSWVSLKTALRDYEEDYIGFVPHPDYVRQYQVANSYNNGLNLFSKSFTKRATPEEIQRIIDSDHKNFWDFLKAGRMGYSIVGSEINYTGFMRVLDATDYSRVKINKDPHTNAVDQNYFSPTEKIAAQQGQKIPFYEAMRDQGYIIFQIGKFSIDAKASEADRDMTKKLLLSWLKQNYLDSNRLKYEKVIFVFNVDSAAHKKLYELDFGAIEVNREENYSHWPTNESLLYVDIKTLFENLKTFELPP